MQTNPTSPTTLLPCPTPWCDGKGGEPYVFERRFDCLGVYCPSCSVSTDYHPTRDAAIEKWNTRPTPPASGEDGQDSLGALSGSHAPHEAPAGLRPSGFDPARFERAVALWLRQEASFARHAQDAAESNSDKLYRMGEKDAYLLAADAVERGHYAIAMEARQGRNREDGSDPKDDSAGASAHRPDDVRLERDDVWEALAELVASCTRTKPNLHDDCGTRIVTAPTIEALRKASAALSREQGDG